ncbi:zinc finger, HIT-type containing 3 L homeolog isoform X1 [Xenopus laevis]|uniref:Zinc finger, HIT-type containing 3 L homeolog isoform X1 n=1 Tax=Xenopus laevis TaxID=8355 RepID=A0A8J1M4R5_XENLA|nr:zinc finger, HIT-type containing 3 L homeolog isoform X1 [Xenopus laevis]
MPLQPCCVCSSDTPKYRCPGCRAKYCSVSCCKKHKDGLIDEDNESDRVPPHKLKLLGESDELKHLLLNPHLRELLIKLDQAEEREDAMKKYMQEPLFVEFADRCLSVVEPEEKENRFPD